MHTGMKFLFSVNKHGEQLLVVVTRYQSDLHGGNMTKFVEKLHPDVKPNDIKYLGAVDKVVFE